VHIPNNTMRRVLAWPHPRPYSSVSSFAFRRDRRGFGRRLGHSSSFCEEDDSRLCVSSTSVPVVAPSWSLDGGDLRNEEISRDFLFGCVRNRNNGSLATTSHESYPLKTPLLRFPICKRLSRTLSCRNLRRITNVDSIGEMHMVIQGSWHLNSSRSRFQ